MPTPRTNDVSPDDREAIRLATRRLTRAFRLEESAALQALQRAATEKKIALVAVALRVLSASPEDLAAGRVLAGLSAPPPGRPRFRGPPPAARHGKRPPRGKR